MWYLPEVTAHNWRKAYIYYAFNSVLLMLHAQYAEKYETESLTKMQLVLKRALRNGTDINIIFTDNCCAAAPWIQVASHCLDNTDTVCNSVIA